MDPISDLGHIPSEIDHSQPDLMISEPVLASSGISSRFDVIVSIVPEPPDLASPWIIRAICREVDTAGQSIAIELIVTYLFVVRLHLPVELDDHNRRDRIRFYDSQWRRLIWSNCGVMDRWDW